MADSTGKPSQKSQVELLSGENEMLSKNDYPKTSHTSCMNKKEPTNKGIPGERKTQVSREKEFNAGARGQNKESRAPDRPLSGTDCAVTTQEKSLNNVHSDTPNQNFIPDKKLVSKVAAGERDKMPSMLEEVKPSLKNNIQSPKEVDSKDSDMPIQECPKQHAVIDTDEEVEADTNTSPIKPKEEISPRETPQINYGKVDETRQETDLIQLESIDAKAIRETSMISILILTNDKSTIYRHCVRPESWQYKCFPPESFRKILPEYFYRVDENMASVLDNIKLCLLDYGHQRGAYIRGDSSKVLSMIEACHANVIIIPESIAPPDKVTLMSEFEILSKTCTVLWGTAPNELDKEMCAGIVMGNSSLGPIYVAGFGQYDVTAYDFPGPWYVAALVGFILWTSRQEGSQIKNTSSDTMRTLLQGLCRISEETLILDPIRYLSDLAKLKKMAIETAGQYNQCERARVASRNLRKPNLEINPKASEPSVPQQSAKRHTEGAFHLKNTSNKQLRAGSKESSLIPKASQVSRHESLDVEQLASLTATAPFSPGTMQESKEQNGGEEGFSSSTQLHAHPADSMFLGNSYYEGDEQSQTGLTERSSVPKESQVRRSELLNVNLQRQQTATHHLPTETTQNSKREHDGDKSIYTSAKSSVMFLPVTTGASETLRSTKVRSHDSNRRKEQHPSFGVERHPVRKSTAPKIRGKTLSSDQTTDVQNQLYAIIGPPRDPGEENFRHASGISNQEREFPVEDRSHHQQDSYTPVQRPTMNPAQPDRLPSLGTHQVPTDTYQYPQSTQDKSAAMQPSLSSTGDRVHGNMEHSQEYHPDFKSPYPMHIGGSRSHPSTVAVACTVKPGQKGDETFRHSSGSYTPGKRPTMNPKQPYRLPSVGTYQGTSDTFEHPQSTQAKLAAMQPYLGSTGHMMHSYMEQPNKYNPEFKNPEPMHIRGSGSQPRLTGIDGIVQVAKKDNIVYLQDLK